MFANPLGLLGLASLAAILGLHLYRRRRSPLVVSAVFLWQDVSSESQGGRQRQPLRRSLSLLAELLAALCLTLALAGPRWSGESTVQHYVAVIDASASLAAESLVTGASARSRAREVIEEQLDELHPESRVTLILTGPEPAVIAGPFAFRDEALSELKKPWPILGDHSATGALLLAAEVAGGGSIDFITDAPPVDQAVDEDRIRWIAVGEACANVGFTAGLRSAGTTHDVDDVRLVVKNNGATARTVSLDLTPLGAAAAGQGERAEQQAERQAARSLTLAPGEIQSIRYTLPSATGSVIARLSAPEGSDVDTFPLDDEVVLCPPPRKTLRLASALPEEASRALGLLTAGAAEGGAQRWAEIVADAQAVAVDAAPHLILTAGPTRPSPPAEAAPSTTWAIRFQRDVTEPSHLIGPFLLDPTHGLLNGVSLDGVVWSMDEAATASPDPSSTTLAYAGEAPLISEVKDPAGPVEWRFHVDPVLSNLGRSADWPILLANAAEERRRALPGPEQTTLAAGDRFLWRGAPKIPFDLVSPSGHVRHIEANHFNDFVTPRLDELGLWQIRRDGGGEPLQEFGVSLLSAMESDLMGQGSLPVPSRPAAALGETTAGLGQSPWLETFLIVLAGALLGLNWWVLRDRVTGPSA